MSSEARKAEYTIPHGKRWRYYNCPVCGRFMAQDYMRNTKLVRVKRKVTMKTVWKWGQDLTKLVSNLKSHQKVYIMEKTTEQEANWKIVEDFGKPTIRHCRRCGTMIVIPDVKKV